MQMNEPVLLVGETGVGKTAVVNYLSQLTGKQCVMDTHGLVTAKCPE